MTATEASGTDGVLPGERIPAVILGSGITALGVVRRLGRLGVESWLVTDRPGFLRGSRWFRDLATRRFDPPAPDGLAVWLRAQRLERAVLVPCTDVWLLAVAALPAGLAARFPASVPPEATARTLVDKVRLAELLGGAGVPHPSTRCIRTAGDWAGAEAGLPPGAFLKPAHSQDFFQAYQQKAFTVEGREEAERRIEEVLGRGLGLAVQEMIPGPADHQLCVDGFVDRGGTVRGRFARRWLRKYPSRFGESCLSVSVALDEVAEAVELADRVIGLLPYRGVFSVELKKDARDGRYRVLEVNVRPWWYIGFTCRAGVDVCRMAYLDALGEPVKSVDRYQVGVYSAYPELDWQAVRALPRAERPPLPRLLATWLRAIQPVFAWDDPGPQLLVFISRLRHRLARATARLGARPAERGTR